ncbi:PadR family transcriptional regulator [Streptomyces sp. NPDC048636]|uniref:PadR family transcriptional regulator n=1 Tax=Streptomyces sp. NPDC048636 TaxID=3155762 RepID=UPI00343E5C7F
MSLRHAVLGLLADHPASGYDLMKLFETSLANVWAANQSQVYGELGKLSDAGLLTVTAEGPRGRKEYAITEDGKAELRRWLTDTPPTTTRRSDALLRVFFLGRLTRLEAVTYLEAEASRAVARRASLQELEASIDWGGDPLSVYGRIVLEYGMRQSAMHEEWARWAAGHVAALDEHAQTPPPGPGAA